MTESSVHVFLALPPLHYGTYWTFTYPASEVNEDALCENEMTTAYQNAFDSSKNAIESEVSKKKECSKSVTLSVTQENPPIIASSQGVGFVAIKIKIWLIIAMWQRITTLIVPVCKHGSLNLLSFIANNGHETNSHFIIFTICVCCNIQYLTMKFWGKGVG